MPTICRFRGIKISINWRDHMPPHFHASYGEDEVIVSSWISKFWKEACPPSNLKCCWAGLRFIRMN